MKPRMAIALLLAAILASGCVLKKTREPALSGSIVFNTHRTDQYDKALRVLADEFEKTHPGTTIKVVGESNSQIETAFAANELADITQIAIFSRLSRESYPEYFLSLDDLGFTEDNLFFYGGGLGVDGKLYAISNCINYDGFVYNKRIFKDVGVAAIPTTEAEFFAVCGQLKSHGVVPVGIAMSARWTTRWYCEQAFASARAGVANYLNIVASEAALLVPGTGILAGMDFLRRIAQNGYAEADLINASWEDLKNDMAEGKIAMAYLGTWFPPQLVERGLDPALIGMFPLPQSKALVSMFDSWYGISRKTANPDLAKAFFAFLFKEDRFAKSLGIIPPSKSFTSDDPYLKELLSFDLPVIEGESDSLAYQNRYAASGLQLYDIAQEYAVAAAPDVVVARVNALWRAAGKSQTP